MHSVSVSAVAGRVERSGDIVRVALAMATAAAVVAGMARPGSAACPWIVQPEAETVAAAASAKPAFDIVFDGLDQSSKIFYGFTVASLDLAWQLASEGALPPLKADARPLEPKITPTGAIAYRLAADTIQPSTIYLVAANRVVRELEQIDARIEPARPMAVSELMPQLRPRTRGGTDWSGPLPRRSVPGFEIAGAERTPIGPQAAEGIGPQAAAVQICAYQVAIH
jgi:hypothetical protein